LYILVTSPNDGKAANTLKKKKSSSKQMGLKEKTQRVNQLHKGKSFIFLAFRQKGRKKVKNFIFLSFPWHFSATKQTTTLISKAHQS
jgi:hypothetical protein